MTGGSVAHQDIVFNLRALLARLLAGTAWRPVQEMRLRIGSVVRYPDLLVCAAPLAQTQRTLSDAVLLFEVLSDDTATIDRVQKLIEYADVPSLQYYILLEQSCHAAVICRRAPAGSWVTMAQTEGAIILPELSLSLPFAEIYRGLVF